MEENICFPIFIICCFKRLFNHHLKLHFTNIGKYVFSCIETRQCSFSTSRTWRRSSCWSYWFFNICLPLFLILLSPYLMYQNFLFFLLTPQLLSNFFFFLSLSFLLVFPLFSYISFSFSLSFLILPSLSGHGGTWSRQ